MLKMSSTPNSGSEERPFNAKKMALIVINGMKLCIVQEVSGGTRVFFTNTMRLGVHLELSKDACEEEVCI